jgi:SAM-dependent methyltransferase
VDSFQLPQSAEYYISLQRTTSQSWLGNATNRLGLAPLFDAWLRKPVEQRRRRHIARVYTDSILRDFESIRTHLPESAPRVLDIGCGLGGIDLAIYRHYGTADLWLLDREGNSPIYYGFRSVAAHYNSLAVSRAFLEQNGVAEEHVTTIDVDVAGFPAGVSFDLVISLLSWGFHYPLNTYIDEVVRALSPDGVVVVDVRATTDGENLLRDRFAHVTVLQRNPKYIRLAVRNPKL